METVERVGRPGTRRRRRLAIPIALLVVALLASLTWAFLDVGLVEEYSAELTLGVAPCGVAIAPTATRGALVPRSPMALTPTTGTVRVHGNHLNYRTFEFVLPAGGVIELTEWSHFHHRHCM